LGTARLPPVSLFYHAANMTTARNFSLGRALAFVIDRVLRSEQPTYSLMSRYIQLIGMSEAQRIDLKAAIEGRITWRQYFAIWGDLSP